MNKTIRHLAYTRSVEAICKQTLAQREAELHATPQWQQWERDSGDLRIAKADVADAETEARRAAMEIFTETDDRAPHPAIKIKDFTVLDYEDTDAFDYARKHLPGALKLVRRAFEKVAKVLELDFVTITKEPRVTIARDLSGYLSED